MTGAKPSLDYLRIATIIILVALAYYMMGRFGLMLAGPSGYASAIWPPSGLALAALLAFGYKAWPGILTGALAVNLIPSLNLNDHHSFLPALYLGASISLGATLQAVISAFIVRKFIVMPNSLENARDIFLLILLGGPVGCIVNTTIGTSTLAIAGNISWSNFYFTWLTWWVGDCIGVIVFAPILLLIFTPRLSVSKARKIIVSLFLCTAFSIAIYVFFSALEAENRRQQANFDRESSYLAQSFDQRLHSYFYILFSIDRLYASSDFVSEDEFHIFVEKLFQEYPGLNALTWRKRVLDEDRYEFEKNMRANGITNFQITDRDQNTGKRFRSPERPVYFPTTYLEFPDSREKILGNDSYNDKARVIALDSARDTGKTVMTDKVTVFREDQKLDAAIMFHPVYDRNTEVVTLEQRREHLLGYITGSFIFSDMVKEIKERSQELGLNIELIDNETESGNPEILYHSTENISKKSNTIDGFLQNFENEVSIGNQKWTLKIMPTEKYIATGHGWSVWLVLISGLIFTGFFGIFLMIITGRSDVIARLVNKKTEELRMQEGILEEINRLNNAVLSSASVLIIGTDTEGNVIVFNREAERSLGYSLDEVLYRQTFSLWHDRQEVVNRASEISRDNDLHVRPGFDVFITIPLLKGLERREWTFIRKDGTKFPGEMTVTTLMDNENKPVGFIGIIQDITERKQMEKMKSEFISTVSHELRTPLTSIRGSLGLIAAGALGVLPEKADLMVKIAHKNSERLVRIINDILDMEKIESGKMQMTIQAVKVKEFLQQAIESNVSYGEKYDIQFVLEKAPEGAMALADPDRLMQVMANLLSNAAKFSLKGGTVHVRASLLSGKIRIEVQDHGTGIPEEFRSRIFEKFAQADSSNTRRFEGTGLGLSITRQFIEAMNGRIGFETEMGKGTKFFFELPQVQSQQDEPQAQESFNRILICEHDKEISEFIKMALEKAGFKADAALTIEEARKKVNEQNYTAITLDLIMPDVNGADFLRELRTNPNTFSLPVIVVSARTTETKKIMNGDALGVIDWLTKPLDEKKLISTLRQSIEHTHQKMPKVLHVEDDKDLTDILSETLRGRARLISAPTLKDAYRELHSQRLDLVIIDLDMPDGSGLELLEHIKDNMDYSLPIVILSATETTQDVQRQVAKALVKSRMSEDKIVETIMSLIDPDHNLKKEIA